MAHFNFCIFYHNKKKFFQLFFNKPLLQYKRFPSLGQLGRQQSLMWGAGVLRRGPRTLLQPERGGPSQAPKGSCETEVQEREDDIFSLQRGHNSHWILSLSPPTSQIKSQSYGSLACLWNKRKGIVTNIITVQLSLVERSLQVRRSSVHFHSVALN